MAAVRKAAFGRTQLFLPSASTILREVKCMGGVGCHATANVYHLLPPAWQAPTGVCCWHCCEPLSDPATCVPLPRLYDVHQKVYVVYGATCSPGCAKAYIVEHTTFDRGQHLNTLVQMLREVYGVTEHVVETPPRASLQRFGGLFRMEQVPRTVCRLVTPPFVSYTMLVEERQAEPTRAPVELLPSREEADTFDEPVPPPLFRAFLATREEARGQESGGKRRRASPKPAPPPARPGSLRGLVRKRNDGED